MGLTDSLSSGGGGGSSGSDLDPSDYTAGNDIQLLKLLSTIGGAAVTLWVGIWIEFMATVIGIHIWIINGVGDFLAELVSELLGTSAKVQVQAWQTTFEATLSEPQIQPFILAVEALVLFAAFHSLRNRGVLP